ncbi:MAG: hypothetical protein Kow0049_32610 [Stanieria sp.]
MVLAKIADVYPDYKDDIFGGDDIKKFSVYSSNNEKIGSVHDILVDETGRFRYFVIDTGFWIFGKKVLLPVGRANVDYAQERIYAIGLTEEQANQLPEYDENMTVDYHYEERVRNTYRTGVESPDMASTTAGTSVGATATNYDRNSYRYDNEPTFYQLSDHDHGNLRQYQQRLMSHRNNFRTTAGRGLYKIRDLYPDYHNIFDNDDLLDYSFYSDTDEKVGSVKDILVDSEGNFRYFVVDTGVWIFGKKIIIPVGRVRIDRAQQRLYGVGLTKEQAENLPEYDDDMTVDYDYEERVRNVYRTAPRTTTTASTTATYDRDTYGYDKEPALYNMNENDHQNLKLYEERLVANKGRFRTGSVAVGKRVETKTAEVSVPIEKERVVIERHSPTESVPVTPGETAFQEGEVARVEVYEESADIEKQAFVREEVSIRKEVEQDTVTAHETVRREELELDADGNPIIERR